MASNKNQGWYILAGLLLLIMIISWMMPKPADWTISYKTKDKIPYGGYIIGHEIDQLFSNDSVIHVNEPIYNVVKGLDNNQTYNYFLISKRPDFSELDIEKIFSFLDNGNQLFITADNFSNNLLDTFGIEANGFEWAMLQKEQIDSSYWEFGNESLSPYNGTIPTKRYGRSSFIKIPTNAKELANIEGKITFIEIPVGKGKLFLHTQPLMFTNYFLLSKNTSEIASVCLSHLPNQKTIYDDYHQQKMQMTQMSTLQEILNRPPLRWAYTLFFVSIFLFMFFHAKRTQRIIPIIRPHQNESVGFAKTVGDLLFQNSSNKAIVKKKIKYFNQHLASRFNIHEEKLNQIDLELLAAKSGHDQQFIKKLIQKMKDLNQKSVVPHIQLMEFTKELNKFYNLS